MPTSCSPLRNFRPALLQILNADKTLIPIIVEDERDGQYLIRQNFGALGLCDTASWIDADRVKFS